MKRRSIIFKAPFEIEMAEETLPGVGPAEVLVEDQAGALHGTAAAVERQCKMDKSSCPNSVYLAA